MLIPSSVIVPHVAGGASYINSVQQVSITITAGNTSNTATISAVGANSFIIYQGTTNTVNTTGTADSVWGYFQLTNSTTVTLTRSGSTGNLTANCIVIDATSSLVASVQQGTIAITGASASNTATITSVNTARSAIFYIGSTAASGDIRQSGIGVTLTNSTTVTATKENTGVTSTVGYVVVEFAAVINSVQKFSASFSNGSTTNTQTITSVNTANTIICYGGNSHNTVAQSGWMWLTLTNGTTVTATRNGTAASSRTPYYTVLEFSSGVLSQVQRGSIALASVASNTATITSAATAKSFVAYLGHDSSTTTAQEGYGKIAQTNATTLTATKNTAGTSTVDVGYEIPTFNQ